MSAPKKIRDLVKQFEKDIEGFKKGTIGEADIRVYYLNPMFEELGWQTRDRAVGKSCKSEVTHEYSLRIKDNIKKPDYAFQVGHELKFFIEAKKPSVNIKESSDSGYQAKRYGYNAGIPVILTDFEEFSVYGCNNNPKLGEDASVSRRHYFTYKDYLEKWDEISNLFSRESVLSGSLNKFKSKKVKKGSESVDAKLLNDIECWRKLLAENIALRNKEILPRELSHVVQKTVDRIIFLRICEDRGIEGQENLKKILKNGNVYKSLCSIFLEAEKKFNSSLFYFSKDHSAPSPNQPEGAQLKLKIDDEPLNRIISRLYFPESPYEFSVMPVEILGQVYEEFLGKEIVLDENHIATVEEKPAVKKAGGVYYTPKYIVGYIVKKTLGRLLDRMKTAKKANKLKILDPSCGSGSFLLGAYQCLLDWHLEKYLEKNKKDPELLYEIEGNWKLTIAEKKRILLNNIYGVDIDPQAVEVCKLSLLLKVLEGESKETVGKQLELFRKRALPNLTRNIKCGNSLIDSDFYENQQAAFFNEEEQYRINTFDWGIEFNEIMSGGGFDAVIGNPPWGASFIKEQKEYLPEYYETFLGNHDSYLFFIEKGIQLANPNGFISFVTPDTWIRVPQAKELRRKILNECGIESLTTLPEKIFKKVRANCIIFVASRTIDAKHCDVNLMKADSNLELLNHGQFDSTHKAKIERWKKSEDFQFQIFQRPEVANLIDRIFLGSKRGIDFLDVMQGIVPYSRENHSDETVKNRLFHSIEKKTDEYGPWIQGRSISRYSIEQNNKEYLKYGKWLHRPRKEKYFNNGRILIQEITGGNPPRITACFYSETLYHDPGIISCLNISNINTLVLLGVLNSRFLSWYHNFSSPKGARKTFPKVLIGDIRNFPIPVILPNHQEKMVSLVKKILDLNVKLTGATDHSRTIIERQIKATDLEIDKLVYELYGLTEQEISIVEAS
jgi:type I restriction-modification system DNA methylase subunit